MKLNFFIILLLLTGCGLFSGSCNSDYDVSSDPTPVPVRFSAQLNSGILRTAAGGDQWSAGDKIGIYMLKNRETLLAENIVDDTDNIPFIAISERSASAFNSESGTPVFYPKNGDKVSFISYYPFKPGLTDYTYPVDVENQNVPADIDILYAKTDNIPDGYDKYSGTVDLTFNHVLSKLSFTLIPDDDSFVMEGLKIQITNLITNATMNLANGSILNANSRQTLTANTAADGLSSSAIVVPQTLSGTKLLMTFPGIDRKFEGDLPSDTELLPGKNNQYIIKVSAAGIAVSSNSSITDWEKATDSAEQGKAVMKYRVGDYYPHPNDPTTAIGIVFSVSDQGSHGKIVSLIEQRGVKWGPVNRDEQKLGVENIRDKNDGSVATRSIILKHPNSSDYRNYQAFHYYYALPNNNKERWYLPAINEMKTLYNASHSDKSYLNDRFASAGGSPISFNTAYWSSTEFDKDYTYFVWRGQPMYQHFNYANKESIQMNIEEKKYDFAVRYIKKF